MKGLTTTRYYCVACLVAALLVAAGWFHTVGAIAFVVLVTASAAFYTHRKMREHQEQKEPTE